MEENLIYRIINRTEIKIKSELLKENKASAKRGDVIFYEPKVIERKDN